MHCREGTFQTEEPVFGACRLSKAGSLSVSVTLLVWLTNRPWRQDKIFLLGLHVRPNKQTLSCPAQSLVCNSTLMTNSHYPSSM